MTRTKRLLKRKTKTRQDRGKGNERSDNTRQNAVQDKKT
jgi:hypothetical protein